LPAVLRTTATGEFGILIAHDNLTDKPLTMNSKIKLLILFLISISLFSCEQKIDPCSACGVKNPSVNLPWLRSAIKDISTSDYQTLTKVDLIEYKSTQLILLTWTLSGIFDVPTGAIYNCNGIRLYNCGGNQPVDSCSFIVNNSRYIANIWHK